MKKLIMLILTLCVFFTFSPRVEAEETSPMIQALDEEALNTLEDFGISSPNADEISNMQIGNIISAISNIIVEKARSPLRAFASISGILMIFSLLDTFRDGLTTNIMKETINTVIVLSVTFILSVPVTGLIQRSVGAVSASAKFMLAYIPAITGILIACGNVITSGSYYAMMVFACQCITQLCSSVIAPLLNIFFGMSITGSMCSVFKLDGLCKTLNKIIKWILGFSMTLFSATLTFKTMITTVADSVSTRAVRFSLSSFIPIVGSALSEAYKTVQSSVRLLKSGIGIFAVIAVIVVFLPVLIECILWLFSIRLCQGASEILMLNRPCAVLEVCATVISTIIAIILSVMAVFIISTTILLMAGGMG